MKSKKLLTIFLATMLTVSSSISVFASDSKSNSKDCKNVSSKNYVKGNSLDKNEDFDKYESEFKDCNIGKAMAAAKAITPCKDANIKECVKNKDYNLGKDVNFGSAIRAAQAKAKEPVKVTPKVEVPQVLKDQIKAEYAAMRATEIANKATFVTAVAKKNQVISYIYKVAKGEITYTDDQLVQLDTLSVTFEADIKAITDATVSIKTAEDTVKECAKSKNYDDMLAALKIEAAARVTRGAALTKVSQDLDAFLLVLVEGRAVLPVVVPAT